MSAKEAANAIPFLTERLQDAITKLDDDYASCYTTVAIVATSIAADDSGIPEAAKVNKARGSLTLAFYKKLEAKHRGWPKTKRVLWNVMWSVVRTSHTEEEALPFIKTLVGITKAELSEEELVVFNKIIDDPLAVATFGDHEKLEWILRYVANNPQLFKRAENYLFVNRVRHWFANTQDFLDLFKM